MIYKKIFLEENNENVYLEAFVADKVNKFVRNAILVIPGGGYSGVCSDREGEPIAMAFMPYGYNAFVLHYTVDRSKAFPTQLIEASMAMKHIKDHAEEYNIDPNRVFVTGFSAGGHLAGTLGIMWDKKEIYDAVDMLYGYNKPAGMILGYPVVSGVAHSHEDSFRNLFATDNPTKEQLEAASLEKQVSDKAVPLFAMHTSNDGLVDVRNTLMLAEAYRENSLTFELHIYPDAPHGVALGNKITAWMSEEQYDNKHIAEWVKEAAEWADSI